MGGTAFCDANQYRDKVLHNYLLVLSGECLGSVGRGPGVLNSDLAHFITF